VSPENFQERAAVEQGIADYLEGVTRRIDQDDGQRSLAVSALFGVAAYALYRLAKNYFDYQRGLDEADLRQVMLQEVEVLVQKGWGRDKALTAVQKVSKEIASLRPDSPAVTAAIKLLKQGDAATAG
jgi:hypothetical protein